MGRPEQRTPGHSRLPITGEVVGSVPEAVEADVDAARAAFDEPPPVGRIWHLRNALRPVPLRGRAEDPEDLIARTVASPCQRQLVLRTTFAQTGVH
jgi:hypothetical protein